MWNHNLNKFKTVIVIITVCLQFLQKNILF